MVHQDRRLSNSDVAWVRSFSCEDVRPLIICRGPIRKEAMDVFEEMGISHYGILVSEKDSIVYKHALAPELRQLTDPERVHRVPDYTGADKEARTSRITQIIGIAKENGYNAIFAGYGFMAEDEALVIAIEKAGLTFIGPCSETVRRAGRKDEAKRTAFNCDVSVTPGIDNVTSLTLISKYPDRAALEKLISEKQLDVAPCHGEDAGTLEDLADLVLNAGYQKGVDLISIDEICDELKKQVAQMFEKFPQNRVRLKAIGGGGGKGQRILKAPSAFEGDSEQARIELACSEAPAMAIEILNEVKANGVGDNKNILVELNIETTRHQEIQVLGNGEWCITMGARDCSLQMHEQKLLEVSQTQEALATSIATLRQQGCDTGAKALETDLDILRRMETEAVKFGEAVGLDNVSTFECIVDRDRHFFMEMNTRIQVEHRVTELCYSLKFTNPNKPAEFFVVDALVEAMVLLARHKKALPMPERIARKNASVEARLNATNAALSPHAGGVINYWTDPIENEIRDDQGISVRNPDTGNFVRYTLAGAYDSNIALLLTYADDRKASYEALAELLRNTRLSGDNLETNLSFHYGLVHWFLAENVNAKSTTGFIMPYLTMVGLLYEQANSFDVEYAFSTLKSKILEQSVKDIEDADAIATLKKAWHQVLDRKKSAIIRPISRLLNDPHLFSGWLSLIKASIRFEGEHVQWVKNPIEVLAETYHYLNMDFEPSAPAAEIIWCHDKKVLDDALDFYQNAVKITGCNGSYDVLDGRLRQDEPPAGMPADEWLAIQGAHIGYQAGSELLACLPKMAKAASYYEIKVEDDLSVTIPERLFDRALQDDMKKVLAPPPTSAADEIGAACGGMFYAREAPGEPPFVNEGDHFEAGDPLYIIEVMKMFNKVYAPFSGTIDKIIVEGEDGSIVAAGQTLFKVTPDEVFVAEDESTVLAKKETFTASILADCF